MPGIFVSYRRQDSQSAAGRLTDSLKEKLPGVEIFRDVETIEPGVDFVEAIGKSLESCGVMLAVIGPRWLNITDSHGRRRLEDPSDYTRLEVATALARPNVRVIPVLVEGAQMPAPEELPDDLKPLARRNAIELTDKRWDYDVSQLTETLRKTLGIQAAPKLPAQAPGPSPAPIPAARPPASVAWGKWAVAAALLLGVGIGVYSMLEGEPTDTALPPTGSISQDQPPAQPLPQPAANGQAGVPDAAEEPIPSAAGGLTGNWQDAEGGRYSFVQQGAQVSFQGMSPHGPVAGVGVLQGNQLALNYSLNDYPYQAVLFLSTDGRLLQGQYRDPLTGGVGPVSLVRLP